MVYISTYHVTYVYMFVYFLYFYIKLPAIFYCKKKCHHNFSPHFQCSVRRRHVIIGASTVQHHFKRATYTIRPQPSVDVTDLGVYSRNKNADSISQEKLFYRLTWLVFSIVRLPSKLSFAQTMLEQLNALFSVKQHRQLQPNCMEMPIYRAIRKKIIYFMHKLTMPMKKCCREPHSQSFPFAESRTGSQAESAQIAAFFTR